MLLKIITLFISAFPLLGHCQVIKSAGFSMGSAFGETTINYKNGEVKNIRNYACGSVAAFIEFISHENINLGVMVGLINLNGDESVRLAKPYSQTYDVAQNYIGGRIKGRIKASESVKVFGLLEPYISYAQSFQGRDLNAFYNYPSKLKFGSIYGVGIEHDMKRVSLSYNILRQELFTDDYNSSKEDFYTRDIDLIDIKSYLLRVDLKFKFFTYKQNS